MASSDLQKVLQQLRQVKNEALQAQHNIALMRKELEMMVTRLSVPDARRNLTGRFPTEQGVRRGTEQILNQGIRGRTGLLAERADPRLRVGGGARFNIKQYSADIDYWLERMAQEKMDFAIQEMRATKFVGSTGNIQAKLQVVVAEMERIFSEMAIGYTTAFTSAYAIRRPGTVIAPPYTPIPQLPTGDLPPQYPMLPPGPPAYGGAPFDAPRLGAGDVRYNVPPLTPIYGGAGKGDVIEATFVDDIKLLEAGTIKATEGLKQVEQASRDLAAAETDLQRKIREKAAGKQPSPARGGAEEEKAAPSAAVRPDITDVQKEFRDLYGVRGPEQFETVQAKATQAGFKAEDIKNVESYADSYARVNYETTKADGITRKFAVTVDKAGNTLVSTQKQFRTFAGAIRRNIGEMVKWSTAVLLVWGSIRKLQELLTLAIENETQLANVAIVLGKSHADLAKIFRDAADAAYATGESITGVIEGYAAAYRATGNIENQTERSRVAQELLTDSLVLSKLSSLSQAEALDTLVGALRQVGLGLDEGTQLIDKWVKVSRYAQVSIETLAESFAITATSASNAGVDIDYLNGLIATIAEVTTLSASESGNAIRAFISSFKSESAVKELGQYGIAVQTLEGETRGFLDIMQEIAALFEAGVISESQLNKIGRAIGGRGARREAQVVAVIKNLTRAEQLAAVGAEAHGEAQSALNIQLETVQTSLTRLDNSFLTLARTMGADGGVLDITDTLLGLFTEIIDAIASVTKNLGDMTPAVAALGLAMAVTSKQTRGFYAAEGLAAISGVLGGISPRLEKGVSTALQAKGVGRSAQFAGAGALQVGAGLFTGYQVIKSVQEKDYESAGGAVAGAIVGGIIAGGNPIGIVIGAAAGKAMANALFNYEGEFENFFKNTMGAGLEDAELDDEAFDPLQEALDTAFKAATPGGTNLAGGRAFAQINAWLENQVTGIAQLLGGTGLNEGQFITPEEFARRQAEFEGRGPEVETAIQRAQEFQQAQLGTGAAEGYDFEFINQQRAFLDEYSDYLEQLEKVQADSTRSRALAGDITDRELRSNLEIIPKLQASISSFAVGFGDEFQKLNPQLKTATDLMDSFAGIMIRSAPEQLAYLNEQNSEIARLTNLLELATEAGEDFIIFKPEDLSTDEIDEIRWGIDQTNEGILELQQNTALWATLLHQAAQASLVELPSITTLDVREEDIAKVKARARELQREFIQATRAEDLNQGISIEEIESTFDPIMLQAGESGGYIYAEGFMSTFIQKAAADMIAAGEVLQPPVGLQLRQLDISSAELPGALAREQSLRANIEEQARAGGFEVQFNVETFAGLLNDYVAVPITADLSLLNLGMNELIDVNKKQLQGVYNLPTDASFYVPFQGYELGLGDGGGAGGLGGAADELTTSAQDLRNAASELRSAARTQERMAHAGAVAASRYDGPGDGLDGRVTEPPIGPWRVPPERVTEPPIGPWRIEEPTILENLAKEFAPITDTMRFLLEFLSPHAPEQLGIPEDEMSPNIWNSLKDGFLNAWQQFLGEAPPPIKEPVEEPTSGASPLGAGPGLAVPQVTITEAILDALTNITTPTEYVAPEVGFEDAVGKFELPEVLGPTPPPDPRLRSPVASILDREQESPIEKLGQQVFQPVISFFRDLFVARDMESPFATEPTDELSGAASSLDSAASSLESVMQGGLLGGLLPQALPTGGFAEFGADFGGVIDLLSQKISNLSGFSTNLKISSTTTTNLVVDGRTLAEVVKPYLYSDMIRFEDSATSVTKNIVV